MANFLEQLGQGLPSWLTGQGGTVGQPNFGIPGVLDRIANGAPEGSNPLAALLNAQPMTDPMAAPQAPPANIMQQAGATPDAPVPAPVAETPPAPDSRQPRERRSVLDTVGRISDVLARVGGAEALYQPTLDAREDRALAKEDRARGIDLEGLKKTLLEQQVAAGSTEATNGLDDRQRAIMGQAVRGLAAINARSGPAGLAAAWPQMAQMLGLDPERTKIIGEQLAKDPEGTLTGLAGALDPTQRQGSQAKELQVYELLKKNSPELAEKYLSGIASGKGGEGMTPYQQAQISLAMRRQGFNEYKFRNPQVKPDAKAAAAEQGRVQAAEAAVPIINDLRDAVERMKNAGSMNAPGQSAEGRVGAWAMQNVPGLERITNPEGFSARQDFDRITTQGISALLPLLGGLSLGGKNIDAAKELETWKKTIASATDYNSALRAIKGFEDRIEQLTAGGSEAPSGGSAPRRRIVPRAAPRRSSGGGGGWGKATVVGN